MLCVLSLSLVQHEHMKLDRLPKINQCFTGTFFGMSHVQTALGNYSGGKQNIPAFNLP
jgi:hypothetical protein